MSEHMPHITGPAPEVSRVDQLVDAGLVAFHGLRAAISNKRMEWAGNRLERMDHKDALYGDLGGITMNSVVETADNQPPKPRTFAERFIDQSLDSAKFDLERAKYRRKKTVVAFGDEVNLSGNRVSRILSVPNRASVNRRYAAGELTARERRLEMTRARGQLVVVENHDQRETREGVRSAQKDVDSKARQPVLRRWRNWRRKEAVKDIKRHNKNANKHENKAVHTPAKSSVRRQNRERRSEKRWLWADRNIVSPVARKVGKVVGKRRAS